jgi:hypothetical protein
MNLGTCPDLRTLLEATDWLGKVLRLDSAVWARVRFAGIGFARFVSGDDR